MAGNDPFGDLEELFDVMTGGLDAGGDPPIDVADAGDEFVVAADLPGYEQDDITVKLTDATTLYLAASREEATISEAEQFVARERHAQSVSRRISLPKPVEESATSATYENGVLTVTLPKRTTDPTDGTDIPVN